MLGHITVGFFPPQLFFVPIVPSSLPMWQIECPAGKSHSMLVTMRLVQVLVYFLIPSRRAEQTILLFWEPFCTRFPFSIKGELKTRRAKFKTNPHFKRAALHRSASGECIWGRTTFLSRMSRSDAHICCPLTSFSSVVINESRLHEEEGWRGGYMHRSKDSLGRWIQIRKRTASVGVCIQQSQQRKARVVYN